jgi:large subunit ribosomal protein L30
MAELKITLSRSVIGSSKKQKAVVKALGLGKTNSSVVREDNPSVRGMINKVSHLLTVEEMN